MIKKNKVGASTIISYLPGEELDQAKTIDLNWVHTYLYEMFFYYVKICSRISSHLFPNSISRILNFSNLLISLQWKLRSASMPDCLDGLGEGIQIKLKFTPHNKTISLVLTIVGIGNCLFFLKHENKQPTYNPHMPEHKEKVKLKGDT